MLPTEEPPGLLQANKKLEPAASLGMVTRGETNYGGDFDAPFDNEEGLLICPEWFGDILLCSNGPMVDNSICDSSSVAVPHSYTHTRQCSQQKALQLRLKAMHLPLNSYFHSMIVGDKGTIVIFSRQNAWEHLSYQCCIYCLRQVNHLPLQKRLLLYSGPSIPWC